MLSGIVKWFSAFPLFFIIGFPISFADAHSALPGSLGSNIFVEIAKDKNPAVVNVSTKTKKRRSHPEPGTPDKAPDPFRDFYERFFGERDNRPRRGMGSGFLIDKDGLVLTNYHVIEGADEIKVLFQDEKEYTARLIGSDSKTDIALIKIESDNKQKEPFPFLSLGDSDKLKVGEWVVAIGNPFGLSHTVTVGVVSAKGRNIGAGPYDDFIQTDASINPGNSGGPLINIKGEVVGINTAIISGNSGGNVGIGFALPINSAKQILADLRDKGAVTRGWLGVMIQKVPLDQTLSFGLTSSEGALVGEVVADGPAAKAGIQRGDVILKFKNQEIKVIDDLPKIVAATSPGTTVSVEIVRDGKKKTLSVTITVMKESEEQTAALGDPLGIQVQDITPELAQSLELGSSDGVLVSDVKPGETAGEAGVRRGDVIAEVNRKPVRSVSEYKSIVSKVKSGGTVLLLVKRGGNTIYIAVKAG